VCVCIYIYVGPGFRGPAVTRVAKREIELHFRDVCVIPSRTHTRSDRPDGDEIPRTISPPRRLRFSVYTRILRVHVYVCHVHIHAPEFTVAEREKKKIRRGKKAL
jgi:hypothetical protein